MAESDFYTTNIKLCEGGYYDFDVVTPDGVIEGCHLGIPGWVTVENAVAAVASMWCAAKRRGEALDLDLLRKGLREYQGVKRRFEFYVNTPRQVYMDDYAHHPEELEATITSVRKMFPGRKLTAVFQPHLYSRTNDFYMEFAESLSLFDEVILCEIYPAREEPIEGVTSKLIYDNLREGIDREMIKKDDVLKYVKSRNFEVLVVLGAGDLDAYVPQIAKILKDK